MRVLSNEMTSIMMTGKEVEEKYDIEYEQIGCDKDHVHILCTAHPKIAPGQIVRVFKSNYSARIV